MTQRNQLTDEFIKNIKPKNKPFELMDETGLFLRVTPLGTKTWYFAIPINKKWFKLYMGGYPDLNLGEAREFKNVNYEKMRKDKGIIITDELISNVEKFQLSISDYEVDTSRIRRIYDRKGTVSIKDLISNEQ